MPRMRAAALGALAVLLLAAGFSWSAPAAAGAADASLRGTVYSWADGRLQRVPQAAVSTGLAQVRTDAEGRFEFAPEARSGRITAIKPGFDVVRRDVYGDHAAIVLRELIVRGVFVPFERSDEPQVQAWVLDLVRRDLINAVVIDIKDEGGNVSYFAATAATDAIGATWREDSTGAFLEELGSMGVYRIGRIVTFLDGRYAGAHPQAALRHIQGSSFRDGAGQRWSSPFKAEARRYNVEIAVAASAFVDEVQFDYVRLPYEDGLAERIYNGQQAREAAINTFAAEAAEALHLAGAALSFDTFGVVAVSADDSGIGQSLRGLSQHLDYLSPMLYPSGWAPGSFGLRYPPQHPGQVIQLSMDATLARLAPGSIAEVRPWLQDFTDYQQQGLVYSSDRVIEQIEQAAAAGGYGFMLWDPSLRYQLDALERTAGLAWSPRREPAD